MWDLLCSIWPPSVSPAYCSSFYAVCLFVLLLLDNKTLHQSPQYSLTPRWFSLPGISIIVLNRRYWYNFQVVNCISWCLKNPESRMKQEPCLFLFNFVWLPFSADLHGNSWELQDCRVLVTWRSVFSEIQRQFESSIQVKYPLIQITYSMSQSLTLTLCKIHA